MNFKRIYLTGFMGSGKSTVGRILADRLKLPFHDLDELIVERAGMSIPDIFEQQGEQKFREMESDIVKACSMEKGVFGLGGGVIQGGNNRKILLSSGVVIYLKASSETLAARLRSETQGRPLLAGTGNLEDRITSLLATRSENYEKAHWSVDTDDLTPEEVASTIHRRLKEKTGD